MNPKTLIGGVAIADNLMKTQLFKSCLATGILLSSSFVCEAAKSVRVNLAAQTETPNAIAQAVDDTVSVQGRGIGTNKTAALKDAYRDAIERAIGFYINAETVAQNDKLVKDEILTHSNAYVKNYKELSSATIDGGLMEVRILAVIQKRALTTKLTDIMPTQTVKLGDAGLKQAFAQMSTKEKRAGDASVLLSEALKGVNPVQSLLVANVRPETQKILTGSKSISEDKVILQYLFELRLDRQKYFTEFVPNLKRVLEQISIAQPKEARLMELVERDNYFNLNEKIMKYKGGDRREARDLCNWLGIDDYGGNSDCGCLDGLHVYSFNAGTGNRVWNFPSPTRIKFGPKSGGSFSWSNIKLAQGILKGRYARATVEVAMITKLNDDASLGQVMLCELDKSTLEQWNSWMECQIGKDPGYGSNRARVVNYSIVLVDKNGNELAAFPWEVDMRSLMNIKFAEQPNKAHVFISPFVGCFGESYIAWKELIVKKDLLPQIDSIKIELAQ